MMKIGYRVQVNKETLKLEEVYVMVVTPFGIACIPVHEYIVEFCDDAIEILEVLMESSEIVAKTDKELDGKLVVGL